ncbi:MAG: hypothetical protein B7Y59_09210 [Burkholderiales bacterium 35-55-47]|nr:MAG: hypothetical protein B7Y59_09210 [Burkholderiales bacterium 35-55-47]OYZ72538.1 MAG: hypothetical protein B7Y06_09915 [Burkholderiales bacterium 24-55-52]OZA99970.1 MAG: hypothetical protein B7X62_08400 [Burkholderiales bacterium 39-55-53]
MIALISDEESDAISTVAVGNVVITLLGLLEPETGVRAISRILQINQVLLAISMPINFKFKIILIYTK